MEIIISDLRAVAEGMFLSGNWGFLAMIIIAALIGVAAMRSMGQILCGSLLAMMALGAIWIVYGGATSAEPGNLNTWTGQLEAGWASISQTSGATMVGYLIVFAASIAILFVGRTLFLRG